MRVVVGRSGRYFVTAIVTVALAASAATAGTSSRAAALEGTALKLGFEAKDAIALARGQVAAKPLEPGCDSELSAMGAVVLPASIDEIVTRFSDLSLLVESGMVVAAHRFSDSPSLDDLAALEIPEEDAKGLVKAKVSDSDVKLSPTEIAALHGRVPPTHIELYKRALLQRLAEWKREGVEGLGTYADKKRPVDQTEVSKELLEQLSAMRPNESLARTDAFEYWATVKFADFKPLVEVNHVSVYRGDGVARIETVQIYASHYCESLVTAVDLYELPPQHGSATLMRLTFRARVDALGGIFGGLKRSIGRGRVVGNLETGLLRVRDTLGAPALAAR